MIYPAMPDTFQISVVDDDESIRESLGGLLKTLGYGVEIHPSAEDFLDSDSLSKTDCLILDISMPGMGGLELQRVLMSRGMQIPIIFITSRADEDVVARVIANGAVACLLKPFTEDSLLEAINRSISE
jgi:FixJ family two-component response regulator